MKFLELAEQVLKQRERDGVRGLDRELSRFRCHIQGATFASKDIAAITSPDIREWLRQMAQKNAEGAGETRKLSRHTINRCQSLVSAVFVEAVERELIQVNPCQGVKAKRRVDESDTKEKWAYLTAGEQAAIAACEAIPRADRLAILFAIATGLRQGEQNHLRLEDVDLDAATIKVCVGSISRDGRALPPKSGKKRTVPLLADGLRILKEWLELLPTFAPSNPLGLVFPTSTGRRRQQGKPLGRSNTLKEYLKLAGITRRVRWHDLRHTCATNLITGVVGRRWSMEEVQVVMGHSSITITQRYAHLGEDALKRAVRETNEATAAANDVKSAPTLKEGPRYVREWGWRSGFFARVIRRVAGRARRVVEGVTSAVA
jgi:integrase